MTFDTCMTVEFVMICGKRVLVSGFVGDREGQAQSRVFINGAAPVPAAHPTDWGKTCKNIEIKVTPRTHHNFKGDKLKAALNQ